MASQLAAAFLALWPLLALPVYLALGLVFASFLGCYLYRWPRGISMWHPRSLCFSCNKKLVWHELIPLISFVKSCGKCNKCKARIGFGVVGVELFGLLMALACWLIWPTQPVGVLYLLAGMSLTCIAYLALRWRRLAGKLLLFSLILMGLIGFTGAL